MGLDNVERVVITLTTICHWHYWTSGGAIVVVVILTVDGIAFLSQGNGVGIAHGTMEPWYS